jgi:hypothetical protein
MEKVLKSFLKRLTNISSSNRSVCLLRLYKEQFFDLHRLDFLYKNPSFHLIGQLLNSRKKILLCDEIDSRDESVNEISKQLRKIARREKLLYEEYGARDLYIGWPFVKGKLSDGSPIRCPLLFFSVSLTLENGKWYVCRREDSEVILNKSFLLAYSHFNHVRIADEWMESTLDDFDKDPTAFRTQLYEFLREGPLEINFNQDLFADKLESFREYTTDDFLEQHATGALKLHSEAVLGIFPQASSYLLPDYETLIERNEFDNLGNFLGSRIHRSDNGRIKEENSYQVFPIDASQEEALQSVKAGKSLVVQGPPGTGKSQLICNLIADFVARGKKVLLVCQKKAALDVVYERLRSKDIHPFAGLVHDFRNDRSRIFAQIADQIEQVEAYQKKNNGLDTIYLERAFTHSSRQISLSQEELDLFRNALFSIEDWGISAKELYLTSQPHDPQIPMREYASRFNLDSSIHFERKIKDYMPYAFRFMKEEYPWYYRISFADMYQRDIHAIVETLEKIPAYQKQLHEGATRNIKSSTKIFTPDYFLKNKEAAEHLNRLILDEDDYFLLLSLLKEKTDQVWLEEKRKKLLACFDLGAPESTLPVWELDNTLIRLGKYLQSRKNFFSRLIWNSFSADQAILRKLLADNDLPFSPEGAQEVTKRIQLRKKFEKEKNSILKKSWTNSIPGRVHRKTLEEWFANHFRILEAKSILLTSPDMSDITEHSENDYKTFAESVQLIPILAADILHNYQLWKRYLAPEMIDAVAHHRADIDVLQEVLKRDFDMLAEFDKIQKNLATHEASIMYGLLQHLATSTELEKVALFRNSIRLQWLEQLETKYPILRAASNLRLGQIEEALQDSMEEKMKISCDILQLRLRESTYQNVEYNRLQHRTTYRDLYHQVTKKRKLWALRRLLHEFDKELFDLIPCWMASPESVSALFPLKSQFDLVIFDEASQCFAEQGLPAIYRGKQVVIAGDSKQLKPNDLYQARWEDETEEHPDLDIHSLLDLASKYLPSVQLTGHYRSRNLDLIDFSNRHFYNKSLELVPYFADVNNTTPSIRYHHVSGLWENNTNLAEAQKVVTLTTDLLTRTEGKSIGIVTFNYKQAQLITDLLEQQCLELRIPIPESLFIKNIENVQGDEKDIILFSIGYAPDRQGRFAMQFGSLNQEGGENRLNVAVTRAREKIFLVASILPPQLSVEESMHEGPKLLKKYLEYAWQVSEGLYRPSPTTGGHQSRDWYLSQKFIESGHSEFELCEELPFADITVKKSGEYHSLIFTDDYLYFYARNSKEMHAYKPLQLRAKGWPYKRVFSRDYWQHSAVSLKI